eukprot:545429-Prymnesium_polylepis.1
MVCVTRLTWGRCRVPESAGILPPQGRVRGFPRHRRAAALLRECVSCVLHSGNIIRIKFTQTHARSLPHGMPGKKSTYQVPRAMPEAAAAQQAAA